MERAIYSIGSMRERTTWRHHWSRNFPAHVAELQSRHVHDSDRRYRFLDGNTECGGPFSRRFSVSKEPGPPVNNHPGSSRLASTSAHTRSHPCPLGTARESIRSLRQQLAGQRRRRFFSRFVAQNGQLVCRIVPSGANAISLAE